MSWVAILLFDILDTRFDFNVSEHNAMSEDSQDNKQEVKLLEVIISVRQARKFPEPLRYKTTNNASHSHPTRCKKLMHIQRNNKMIKLNLTEINLPIITDPELCPYS